MCTKQLRDSAVGLAPVKDGGDLNADLAFEIEEHPVVAAAETEAAQRRFELFHVAGSVGQVAIHTSENLHGRFAIDGAQIRLGFRRPDDRDPLSGGFLAHCSSPNSRRISSCGTPSPRASEARAFRRHYTYPISAGTCPRPH